MSKLIWPNSRIRICLSFKCNFRCDYCSIQHFQEDLCNVSDYRKEEISTEKWVRRIRDVVPSRPLLFIFGAGEAGILPGIDEISNNIKHETHVYTNASNPAMKGLLKIKPRNNFGFYISFHPTQIDVDEFIANAKRLQKEKYNLLNIHIPAAPSVVKILPELIRKMVAAGLPVSPHHPYLTAEPGDYQFYDELGELPKFKNRFASRAFGKPKKTVYCKTSFNHANNCNTMSYPIAPDGNIYWCWRYLFEHSKEGIMGNFFDEEFQFKDEYFECDHYGDCNMCAWDRNIIDKETGKQLDTDVIEWEYLR